MPAATVAIVAIRSLSLLSPSPLCPHAVSALSFPSPEGPSPISFRAPLSNTDERVVSAGGGDDGGGKEEGGGGGGGGRAETGRFLTR